MNIKAFVDAGNTDNLTFCYNFFNSPEFTTKTLQKILKSSGSKDGLALDLAEKFTRSEISTERIIRCYADQNRQWVTFKMGEYGEFNTKNVAPISDYLTKIGMNGQWYGPVSLENNTTLFIKSIHSYYFQVVGSGEAKRTISSIVRWPIIAKVNPDYVSLHWNGFSINTMQRMEANTQYDFWNSVPEVFNEIEEIISGGYVYPLVNSLVLHKLWDKYLIDLDSEYQWKHLAVRAESSGVALNARSAGVSEIGVKGLLALANRLSRSVVEGVAGKSAQGKDKLIEKIENIIIKALIQEWGTKSYEFSIDQNEKKIFRAHCYFGSKPDSSTQDQFPHFKTFQKYGGDSKAIEFLLNEA